MLGWRACGYLLTALLLSATVEAQSLSLTLGADRVVRPGSGGISGPPLDSLTAASGAYSFRKIRTAYAGSAVRLRRASDGTQTDIGFTGTGDFNTAAATTFCAATSCFIAKWYDQSGFVQDLVQAVGGNQPAFVFSCFGAQPCLSLNAISLVLTAPTMTQPGTVSFNNVFIRSVGTNVCNLHLISTNIMRTRSGVAGLTLVGAAGGSLNTNSAENAWHSATGVINGASSYFAVDGATISGLITGSTTAATYQIQSGGSTTCNMVENIIWEGYALTAGEAAALNTNQHTYWGF